MKEKETYPQPPKQGEDAWPTAHGSWANAWCMAEASLSGRADAGPSAPAKGAAAEAADSEQGESQRPAP